MNVFAHPMGCVIRCARIDRRMGTATAQSNINPNPFTTRPEIDGTFGVVASTHWIATAVGMATLEKGGNAFDAAVATAFTLAGGRAASQRARRRCAGDRA